MTNTFVRTIHSDHIIECSWYDVNGKRYKHETSTLKYPYKTVKEYDDSCGHLPYAKQKGFNIITNYIGEHPKTVKGLKKVEL